MSFFVSESLKGMIDETSMIEGDDINELNKLNYAVLQCCYKTDLIQFKILNFKFAGKQLTLTVESNLNNFELIYFKKIKPKNVLFRSSSLQIHSDVILKNALYQKETDQYLIELSFFRCHFFYKTCFKIFFFFHLK